MKHNLWPIVILIIAVIFALMSRYSVIVKPPIVVKVDLFTGESWIVNSGYWVKVQDEQPGKAQEKAPPAPTGEKASS